MNQYEHLAKTGYLLGVYDGGFHLDGLSWKIYEEREATENYNRKKNTTVGFEPKPENALKIGRSTSVHTTKFKIPFKRKYYNYLRLSPYK